VNRGDPRIELEQHINKQVNKRQGKNAVKKRCFRRVAEGPTNKGE